MCLALLWPPPPPHPSRITKTSRWQINSAMLKLELVLQLLRIHIFDIVCCEHFEPHSLQRDKHHTTRHMAMWSCRIHGNITYNTGTNIGVAVGIMIQRGANNAHDTCGFPITACHKPDSLCSFSNISFRSLSFFGSFLAFAVSSAGASFGPQRKTSDGKLQPAKMR